MSTTTTTSANSTTTTTSPPKKQKKKRTAEEIRQLRKRKKAIQQKKRLQNQSSRLDYIQKRINKDELKQKEKDSEKQIITQSQTQSESNPYMHSNNSDNVRDAFNNSESNPFINHSNHTNMPPDMEQLFGANPFLTPNSSANALDPNMEINEMVQHMFGGVFGDNESMTQTSEQRIAKQKHREKIDRFDTYSHLIFCVLFVILLVFLPFEYDIGIFGYNLSSDAWTYFIAFELVLFSVFYGYKQYRQRKRKNANMTANSNGMNGDGAGQLMSMLGGSAGAAMFGGGNEMSQMIQKWIERAMMLWDYIKMFRQLLSDLCLILFLWIVLTAIKTLFVGIM